MPFFPDSGEEKKSSFIPETSSGGEKSTSFIPDDTDNALEDTLTARKKQLEDQQKQAYEKEAQIKQAEQQKQAIENDPKNWSSSRIQKDTPQPNTLQEKAQKDAAVSLRREQEHEISDKILGKNQPQIGPPTPGSRPASPKEEEKTRVDSEAAYIKKHPGEQDVFEAFQLGLVPYSTQGQEHVKVMEQAHPTAKAVGQMTGMALSMLATAPIEGVVQAQPTIRALRAVSSPALKEVARYGARAIPRAIHFAASGFTKAVLDNSILLAQGGRTIAEAVKDIAQTTADMAVFALPQSLANPIARIPAIGAEQYVSSLMQGHDQISSLASGVLGIALGLLDQSNFSVEEKALAYRKTIGEIHQKIVEKTAAESEVLSKKAQGILGDASRESLRSRIKNLADEGRIVNVDPEEIDKIVDQVLNVWGRELSAAKTQKRGPRLLDLPEMLGAQDPGYFTKGKLQQDASNLSQKEEAAPTELKSKKAPETGGEVAKTPIVEGGREGKLFESVKGRPFSELTREADTIVGQMINEGIASKDLARDEKGKIYFKTEKGRKILTEDVRNVYKQFSQQVEKGAKDEEVAKIEEKKPVKLSEVEKKPIYTESTKQEMRQTKREIAELEKVIAGAPPETIELSKQEQNLEWAKGRLPRLKKEIENFEKKAREQKPVTDKIVFRGEYGDINEWRSEKPDEEITKNLSRDNVRSLKNDLTLAELFGDTKTIAALKAEIARQTGEVSKMTSAEIRALDVEEKGLYQKIEALRATTDKTKDPNKYKAIMDKEDELENLEGSLMHYIKSEKEAYLRGERTSIISENPILKHYLNAKPETPIKIYFTDSSFNPETEENVFINKTEWERSYKETLQENFRKPITAEDFSVQVPIKFLHVGADANHFTIDFRDIPAEAEPFMEKYRKLQKRIEIKRKIRGIRGLQNMFKKFTGEMEWDLTAESGSELKDGIIKRLKEKYPERYKEDPGQLEKDLKGEWTRLLRFNKKAAAEMDQKELERIVSSTEKAELERLFVRPSKKPKPMEDTMGKTPKKRTGMSPKDKLLFEVDKAIADLNKKYNDMTPEQQEKLPAVMKPKDPYIFKMGNTIVKINPTPQALQAFKDALEKGNKVLVGYKAKIGNASGKRPIYQNVKLDDELGFASSYLLTGGPVGEVLINSSKELVHILAPRVGVNKKALDRIMEMKGARDKVEFELEQKWLKVEEMFEKMPKAEQIAFVDNVKTGKKQPTPELQSVADIMRQVEDQYFAEVQKFKPGLQYLQDHFRVFWKQPGSGKVGNAFRTMFRRPLEGTKGFMRAHVFKDMSTGIKLGLEPVTYNPMTMWRNHIMDMQKFITAHGMFDAVKKMKFLKFVKPGGQVPDGFVRLDDKIAKVYFPAEIQFNPAGEAFTVPHQIGEYYIEENVGRILNNFLSKDWIRASEIGKSLLAFKNMTTAFELSLSPFHAAYESGAAVASQIGIGYQKIWRGDFVGGLSDILLGGTAPGGLSRLGGSVIRYVKDPVGFIKTTRGASFIKQFPNAAQLIQDAFTGGMKFAIHQDYKINAIRALREGIKNKDYGPVVLCAIPAGNELIMKPLFEVFIPRLKLGTFFKEFSEALVQYKDRLASGEITRPELARRIVDSVENRFGEMNFDNLFWNRTFKSALQLFIRSVTWKVGALKNVGVAVPGQISEIIKSVGAGRKPILESSFAYLLGIATLVSAFSAVIMKLYLNEWPKDYKDLMAPRYDKDGNRIMLNTHLKDWIHIAHSPINFLSSSSAGYIGRMIQLWQNKNFWGTEIVHKDDPPAKKAWEAARQIIGEPFVISSTKRASDLKSPTELTVATMLGVTQPAPKYLSQTEAEKTAADIRRGHIGTNPRTQEEFDRSQEKQKLRLGAQKGDTKDLKRELSERKITPREYKEILKESKMSNLQRATYHMSVPEVVEVYNAASSDEKAELLPILKKKLKNKLDKTSQMTLSEEKADQALYKKYFGHRYYGA